MSTEEVLKKKAAPRKYYSESFKRMVVQEYESGLSTKATLRRKYGISGHSTLSKWLKKYGKLYHHSYSSIGRPLKDKNKQYIKELESQLKKQEKEFAKKLADKDFELYAFKKLIKVAEKELNIKIVKKSGTKQSKK
jgi:transposase-like protein